jgi:hypothetical protein
VTNRLPHALRSDARDNRELILDAARTVFATEGLNVPMRSVGELAHRAKDAGHLRPDFVLDDLILILMANSGIRAASPAAAVAASRRFAALTIQAFQASPETPPLPPVAWLAPVVLIR